MRDRLPAPGKENRVRIRQDNGQVVEGVMEYADDATQEGSAYTKGNVLPDDVCQELSIVPDTSEPKDAFLAGLAYTREQIVKSAPTTFQKLMTGRLI